MESSDWIAVAAILLAPLVALQLSVWLEKYREKRRLRLAIFKDLMATRATRLAPDHVQALNMIDVEFYGTDKKSTAVLRAWKAYLDHLGEPQNAPEVWGEELYPNLVYGMIRRRSCLGVFRR